LRLAVPDNRVELTRSEAVVERMDWKTMLAYITGSVDEELLLRNEYLAAENRVLRDQINGRLKVSVRRSPSSPA